MSTQRSPATGGVRYAPSPTGRFHIGNLRTAWISFRLARNLGLPWVVRFEDIDQPRVLAGAREQQLDDLAALGMTPDILLTQSEFRARHWELLVAAVRSGRVYACDCSRREVQAALATLASAPHDGLAPVYSGSCRARLSGSCRTRLSGEPVPRPLQPVESLAWRFRMPDETGHADFIVARSAARSAARSSAALDENGLPDEASFVPAYHWACAIDDHDGAYDLLVRSSDLAPAASLQRAIQSWLGTLDGRCERPAVFHTSLVTQNDGQRLEKRTRGVTLPELAARGLEHDELLRKFEASFTMPAPSKPGDLGHEGALTVTLAQLGLEISDQ